MSSSFNFIFIIVIAVVAIILVLLFRAIVITIIKSNVEWNKKGKYNIITVDAKVAAKRTAVSSNSSLFKAYYVTFELKGGNSMEFVVLDTEYDMLIEGDIGRLTYHGTMFEGFEHS